MERLRTISRTRTGGPLTDCLLYSAPFGPAITPGGARRPLITIPPSHRQVPRAMLSRSITPLHATALVVGIIIGASIFVQPSVITGTVPTLSAVYAVWIASGILTMFGALIAAELASAYPQAGGVYVFLREAFSPAVAFLWGWAMFWTMHTGIIAVIAMVFARYVAFFIPVGDVGLRLLAVSAIVMLTAVNYIGVRQGSLVQTTLTIVKVGAVIAIIAAVFTLGPRHTLSPRAAKPV